MIEASGEGDEEGEEDETAEPPAQCPAHQPTPAKKGTMTDREVLGNSLGFLGAGSDTTSITLSFMSYLLALHPDIQEKLQSEIDAYFEDTPVSNEQLLQFCIAIEVDVFIDLSTPQDSSLYTAAQEIPYLDQVLQECLRLYPPGPE